jgi:hypothetical protein
LRECGVVYSVSRWNAPIEQDTLGECAMDGSSDRRAAERMPVNSGTGCGFASPMVEDFGPAKIRDVSLDGVGLIVMRRVEVGSLLVIGLENPSRNLSKTMIVRVAHVTAVPGGFLVGGSFAEPLTYQELTSLVM